MTVMICVRTMSYANGGVTTHIIALSEGLTSMGHKVVLCCEGGERIDEVASIKGVIYYPVSFQTQGKSLRGLMYEAQLLMDIIKKENVDIIHVHSQRIIPVLQFIKLVKGIPYVWTNHIDAVPNRRVMRMMCKVFRFPVISVSVSLQNLMLNEFGVSFARSYVINNGIDLKLFEPLTVEERRQLEQKYHIDRGGGNALCNQPFVQVFPSKRTQSVDTCGCRHCFP